MGTGERADRKGKKLLEREICKKLEVKKMEIRFGHGSSGNSLGSS